MKHLLTLMEFAPHEVEYLLRVSREFKTRFLAGEIYTPLFPGRVLILYFEKHSTRTRLSLTSAAAQLGIQAVYTTPNELQIARGETVADTMRVISRYAAAVAARVYKHETLEEMARHSAIPVINALSDKHHPLQALADALTLWERAGRLHNVKIAFVGDVSNNVATSLAIIGAKLGWEVRLVGPKQLWNQRLVDELAEDAAKTGARIYFTDSINEVAGVDGVYTDVWVSMGFEKEAEERRRLLKPYQVNQRVMEIAGKKAVFLHCLPAHRGEEVTDDVIDGPQSAVWDQAENRMHTAKAVLAYLLK
ncbi:ornithine carbamoyltransferase [Pyrobaculum aerophilum]|uniref:Ornithine carbamoyltransferase n=2 Tax=Pyrobaculum aerophilum TaxID=13773 RepID=OTC_PYRAE|nr:MULTISPECIES: ornithine carbamoyltransferase [Pyrobaculum]Q8ZW40.3 RecName: Full=Ornithine carbamoyltransferase; Short=OTCase [Pyrobaculum aerophilum str. IM2]AAL63862.1 ornithine carbamoyltransferase (argF) [Pyrobaculum aerophilum str. IM2]MCX8136928.1 ornithine carbamoyltransferase [Pyrobaculum aerophilum]HII46983.1 ornithine carbamoyltransferase [Pyrobaculum aerophilum]